MSHNCICVFGSFGSLGALDETRLKKMNTLKIKQKSKKTPQNLVFLDYFYTPKTFESVHFVNESFRPDSSKTFDS